MLKAVYRSLALLAAALPSLVGAETVYVRAGRLLDVEAGRYVSDPLIVVTDGGWSGWIAAVPRPPAPR
jgi:hypothetical protein